MRILISTGLNSGEAEYRNIGDVAMLQAAVDRVSEFWPEAEILVLTDSPTDLVRFCPNARPLSRNGAKTWVGDHVLLGQLHRLLPDSASNLLSAAKQRFRTRRPGILRAMLRARFLVRDSEDRSRAVESFLSALETSDLLLICGSGGFADSCREWNLFTLALIETAMVAGVPVALTGQGIGPISDCDVIARMRRVLPHVALFASRGTRGADALARELGIPGDVFCTTGDDAVEPAYKARPALPGCAIGVNLRVATYSGVSEDVADVTGAVLRSFAESRGTTLVPLPIATHAYANDANTLGRILGTATSSFGTLDSPQYTYAQTARCRLVVTGAYHAAVFALSQGIPAICISGSDYYAFKFAGLRSLFGAGCTIIDLQQEDLEKSLSVSLQEAWKQADCIRQELLDAARTQINASRNVFLRLQKLFPAHSGPGVKLVSIP
jgi:polysaccharide pyruvyl transferase WcaK-like protein